MDQAVLQLAHVQEPLSPGWAWLPGLGRLPYLPGQGRTSGVWDGEFGSGDHPEPRELGLRMVRTGPSPGRSRVMGDLVRVSKNLL